MYNYLYNYISIYLSTYLSMHTFMYINCNILFTNRRGPSSKTVKQKRIQDGSHVHDLMKHASRTLGSGNIKLAVQLPDGEDLNEWIAVNSKLVHRPASPSFAKGLVNLT